MSGYLETVRFFDPYFPVLVLLIIALSTAVGLVVLSQRTGPRVYNKVKYSVYECGVDPLAPATVRVSVKYYMVAILYRSLGLLGFIEMAVFVGILLVGLVYAWKKGALEWQ
jgi:NADH-quinone oxidoreductase subunit A